MCLLNYLLNYFRGLSSLFTLGSYALAGFVSSSKEPVSSTEASKIILLFEAGSMLKSFASSKHFMYCYSHTSLCFLSFICVFLSGFTHRSVIYSEICSWKETAQWQCSLYLLVLFHFKLSWGMVICLWCTCLLSGIIAPGHKHNAKKYINKEANNEHNIPSLFRPLWCVSFSAIL